MRAPPDTHANTVEVFRRRAIRTGGRIALVGSLIVGPSRFIEYVISDDSLFLVMGALWLVSIALFLASRVAERHAKLELAANAILVGVSIPVVVNAPFETPILALVGIFVGPPVIHVLALAMAPPEQTRLWTRAIPGAFIVLFLFRHLVISPLPVLRNPVDLVTAVGAGAAGIALISNLVEGMINNLRAALATSEESRSVLAHTNTALAEAHARELAQRTREAEIEEDRARERRELEEATRLELLAANATLEGRVRERTADLEAKNDRLAEALTTLHRTQEQLVHAEKMASLGLMVAGIAHELKNPLNFVNNFAELSLEFADEIDALMPALPHSEPGAALAEILPDLVDNLRRIHEHGRRADGIIAAMLLHAREEARHPVATDLNDLVRAHVVLAYQGFRAGDREFHAEIVEDLGPDLDAIPLSYQDVARVVMNLVSNACHALRQRSHVQADAFTPTITVCTRRDPDALTILIRDNGIGVSESIRRRIFDPFFTTKPPGEGTGLGLSICYDIVVEQLGGRLDLTSTSGVGAEFRVRLPLARDEHAAPVMETPGTQREGDS